MRKISIIGSSLLGLAAAFAGLSAQVYTATAPTAKMVEEVAQRVDQTKTISSRPAPAKPTAQPAARRTVAMQPRELMPASIIRFIEKSYLRKVKYGKRRWVLV